MSDPTIRITLLDKGEEAMSLDVNFNSVKDALDSYFFCAEKLLSPEEYAGFISAVEVSVAQRVARKARLQ